MESREEFSKIDIKNCMCYYSDDIMPLKDTDFINILLDKKSHKNLLIYNISYKTFMGEKPLCIGLIK